MNSMQLLKRLLGAPLLAATLAAFAIGAAAADEPKTLRIAFRVAETGFDPAQINDLYSRYVTAHIFEGLYTYDHLARPYKVKPLVADGLPEHSPDYKVWTIKVKPGIYFQDDAAFKGQKRELVAQDFVYSFKRFYDPAVKSPVYSSLREEGIVGMEAVREESLKNKKPFDYDREVEGLKALDRYTLRFTLDKPRPRFWIGLASSDLFGAVAREVAEFYGAEIPAHPVGTGPFKLGPWRRSSLIVLERNPTYRERYYDAEPSADDAEGQAIAARLKGRRLPMLDRVEINIIEEQQPRWLAFLNGELDLIDPVPELVAKTAVPNGKIAPNLAKKGIKAHTVVNSDVTFTFFNMEDPVVGGYTPEKVALRRAFGLALDLEGEIRLVRSQQGIVAQSGMLPNTDGYDPKFRSVNGEFDPARAKALLDLYGYIDRDGDGWREQPDGSALVIDYATEPDQFRRALVELMQKNLAAVGIKLNPQPRKWPENLKSARAGKLQVWSLATSAAGPDGQSSLMRVYGPMAGGQNLARFKLPALDALFDRASVMPDGPERLALMTEMNKLVVAYAPYKYHVHRIYADLTQSRLIGYRRPIFWLEQYQYYDVEGPPPAR